MENRNIYIAKTILEIIKSRPQYLVMFLGETISFSTRNISRLFPGLAKEELAQGLLSLKEEGALLDYENWEETCKKKYDEIAFFDFTPSKKNLEHFIRSWKSNTFGFRLSDESYRKSLITTLNLLVESSNKAIEVTKFENEYAYDILEKLEVFSNAISIEKDLDLNYDQDENGQISVYGSGYVPNIIIINNKPKLITILNEINKIINNIYENGVNRFLFKNKSLIWRCVKCGRWFGCFKSRIEIMQWLDRFSNGGHKICHKCRSKNVFSISSMGNIKFLIKSERG
jgi:hypothetical protein